MNTDRKIGCRAGSPDPAFLYIAHGAEAGSGDPALQLMIAAPIQRIEGNAFHRLT